jgi:aspartyl protease family protein
MVARTADARMTRPIVWALGTMLTAAISATSAIDQVVAVGDLLSGKPRSAAADPAEAGARLTIAADLLGHFVVHPTLDGRRVRMLVDTGASFVALSHEDARLAGIRVSPGDFTHRIQTANGVVSAASVRIGEVRVGDITVRGVDALVLPPNRLATSLLGMTFLKRLGGFEMAQGRLILKG